MVKRVKKFTLQMIAGANVASAIIMLLVGNVDKLHPAEHPMLSTLGLIFPLLLLINVGFLAFFAFFKRKYIIVPLVGLLVCYQPVRKYRPMNVSKDVPSGAIKVLTYNVFHFERGDTPEGELNPILEYIVASGADIVCLQEGWIDAEVLSAVSNAYKYIDSARVDASGECLVVMSQHPIVGKERIKYPSKGNLSAAFKIKIGKDTVTVVNNHFETSGLSKADRVVFKDMIKGKTGQDSMRVESKRLLVKLSESAKIRAPQAEAVAEYVRRCHGNVILCGDFNDTPLSYTHHVLEKELTDCYIATGNGPGFSYHHNAIFVRIDNIMCSSDWKPYACKVDKSIGFSDHYPVYCWLENQGKPADK